MDEIIPAVVVVPPDPVETQIEEAEEELDLVAEQVAVSSIVSEEHHDELMEGISECREKLTNLSTSMQTESPMSAQILNELGEIRARITTMESRLPNPESNSNTNPSNLEPSESIVMEPVLDVPRQVESTEEHEPAERVRRKKKYRVI